jgi:hypothetical protein
MLSRPLLNLVAIAATAAALAQGGGTITMSAKMYVTNAPIDTIKIKALGSVDTKATPVILQVTRQEAQRVVAMAERAGAMLLASPVVRTANGQQAQVSITGDKGVTLVVKPSSRSDMITLPFRLTYVYVADSKRHTMQVSGFGRVVETKVMLVITNPRNGEMGTLAVIEGKRGK